ncbi:MAG: hypothetical protein PHF11_05490 [Candidatus Omnitrophica bacterium]|nr:hypothetical protein [Candidatus Omnitrophota bacterium]
MMKSRLSLKNSARAALNSLILTSLLLLLAGCSSSPTVHTYSIENLAQSIQDVSKKEYNLDIKAKLVVDTLWVYMPVEDLLVKSDKPEKYTEKFTIERVESPPEENGDLKFEYMIKTVEEKEKAQEYKYNKSVLEKNNDVWKVLRRVVFSLDRSNTQEPKFYCLLTADIKNGFFMKELFYYLDLKKVSYEYISWGEYQHRVIQDVNVDLRLRGDKDGDYIDYKDITMKEFITEQILHRIKLKFQRPEVGKNADIDKEIIKIIAYTVKTYDFKDFDAVELDNLETKNTIVLNRAALLSKATD